ncbi:anti-sigma factor domain-containing protein [Robertmurraya massiliosenegalensis]|uniref:anti-sigma factor domain-containing protein n=1 Tax=Robertmurraya massiliosenegalensis TaxID=1287657 RepID=UPI0002FDDA3D|nr:anti-sigma factor domain-containing protein [Robertmurraya massiliosenegalensis]
MRTGIIMEKNGRFLTLLTPDGEFLKISSDGEQHDIGEEIPIPTYEKRKSSVPLTFFQTLKGKSMVAVAVACLFVIFTFIPLNQNEVYAYMSIDVNPSIELGFNDELKVIELIPYNEEGREIVEEMGNWKHKDIHEVTANIVTSIKEKGYIEKEQEIVIGTVHLGEAKQKTEQEIQKTIHELEKTILEDQAKVTSYEATSEERKIAIENGVTTGKLKSEQKKEQKPSVEEKSQEQDQKQESKEELKKDVKEKPANSQVQENRGKVNDRNKEDKRKNGQGPPSHVQEKQKNKVNDPSNKDQKTNTFNHGKNSSWDNKNNDGAKWNNKNNQNHKQYKGNHKNNGQGHNQVKNNNRNNNWNKGNSRNPHNGKNDR